jgi:hypothetical protein
VSRLKIAGKVLSLSALGFAVAFAVGLTPVPASYAASIFVSVLLCPLVFGFFGAHFLNLGLTATILGIGLLPIAVELDQEFHLGAPPEIGWLVLSLLVAAAGWRLGRLRPGDAPADDMAK